MTTKPDKQQQLRTSGTLNRNPKRVNDPLFCEHAFFDARDLVQVKYEMLRRVRVDGCSVSQAAACYGLSRPTYYQARDTFDRNGLTGLLPEKKGPKRAHKLKPEVLSFVEQLLEEEPGIKPLELGRRIREEFNVKVHPKSISRALSHKKKSGTSPFTGNLDRGAV